MPTIKSAYIRYKVLDQCFRSKKKYYIEDLIKACEEVLLEINSNSNGISLRQIREDIAFMKSKNGWSIELGDYRDGKRMYYRYVDPNFSINNMPLNDIELEHLKSAFEILSQFKGMPQFEWIHELLPKLKVGMSPIASSKAIMEFDYNSDLKGIELLGDLYTSITSKTVLKILYKPYGTPEPFAVIIHPYYLKQHNNRWFLFGFNPEWDRRDWNLPLDRIVNVSSSKVKYIVNTLINWEEYFDDIVGVTKPDNQHVQKVILNFKGRTGNYIETKPLHRSQKSKWLNEDTLEVRLEVMLNYELERLILSYAESVVVMHPVSLVNLIHKRLNEAIRPYLSAS